MEMDQQVAHASIRATNLTVKTVLQMMRLLARRLHTMHDTKQHTGHQKLKYLTQKSGEIKTIDVAKTDLKMIQRELRRLRVDFSVIHDRSAGKYHLFFRGDNVEALEIALTKCAQRAAEKLNSEKQLPKYDEQMKSAHVKAAQTNERLSPIRAAKERGKER